MEYDIVIIMTAIEMQKAIGQTVLYKSHGMKFVCVVRDVKVSYGKPRFLITPMAGQGETYVEYTTISPMPANHAALRYTPERFTVATPIAAPVGQNGMQHWYQK